MKIALYIEDGLEQIVLTPETETERGIIERLHDESRDLSIKRGQFYRCQGGWTRWTQGYGGSPYYSDEKLDESTMIVLRKTQKTERGAQQPPPSDHQSDISAAETGVVHK
jgi:hypothetical protein